MNFKFFYVDSEGDMISITSQDDLDEALECMQSTQALKLILEESIEAARRIFEAQSSQMGDIFRNSQLQQPSPMSNQNN